MKKNNLLFEVTLDTGALIIDFNDIAENITGYKKEEVLHKNWFEIFIDEKNILDILDAFDKTLQSGPSSFQHTNQIKTKDNKYITIKWDNKVTTDKYGIPIIQSKGEVI